MIPDWVPKKPESPPVCKWDHKGRGCSESLGAWVRACSPDKSVYWVCTAAALAYHADPLYGEGGTWYEWYFPLRQPVNIRAIIFEDEISEKGG